MSHDVLNEATCLYYSFQREYSQTRGVLKKNNYEYYLKEFKIYIGILEELYRNANDKFQKNNTEENEKSVKQLDLMLRKFKRTLVDNF